MFELRDTQSDSSFSGRVNDVFSALGSGSVKQPDKRDDKDFKKPDFDHQQLKRSINQRDRQPAADRRREDDRQQYRKEGSEFKHPAELLRAAGGEGGNRRGDGNQRDGDRRGDGGHRGGGNRRGRPDRGRRVPDFKKNPGKWTKYSLADIDNMTDRSNTAAALQFLQTLKDKTEDDHPAFDPSQKLVFKKPSKIKETTFKETKDDQQNQMKTEAESKDMDTNEPASSSPAQKGTFVGAKQIMPEFNFGAKRSKNKPEKTATKSAKHSKEMKLSHLDDEECDE